MKTLDTAALYAFLSGGSLYYVEKDAWSAFYTVAEVAIPISIFFLTRESGNKYETTRGKQEKTDDNTTEIVLYSLGSYALLSLLELTHASLYIDNFNERSRIKHQIALAPASDEFMLALTCNF